MKNTITVIGLGIFGSTIALELTRLGHDVLGIDSDSKRVGQLVDRISMAPPPSTYLFELGDQIVLFGTLAQLRKISKYL